MRWYRIIFNTDGARVSKVMTSSTSGYIYVRPIKGQSLVRRTNMKLNVTAPSSNVIMFSVSKYSTFKGRCPVGISVYTQNENGSKYTLWQECETISREVYVFHTHRITLQLRNYVSRCYDTDCFKTLFSFHSERNVPQKLSSGLFNCSVDDYWRFQQHLDCNLKVECEDGRDEAGHCPFSSPACHGWVASGRKCFRFVSETDRLKKDLSLLMEAARFCSSVNATLGKPQNHYDVHHVFKVFSTALVLQKKNIVLNLFLGGISVPSIYRRSLVSEDKTVIYHSLKKISVHYTGEKLCFTFHNLVKRNWRLEHIPCSFNDFMRSNLPSTCEFMLDKVSHVYSRTQLTQLPNISFEVTNRTHHLTRCANGQATHAFLSCGPHNTCIQKPLSSCTFSELFRNTNSAGWTDVPVTAVPEFSCDASDTKLSYTLVCDFRPDCDDDSDESFCQHPSCDAFTCTSGQCVSYGARCNMVSDCTDDTDEIKCEGYTSLWLYLKDLPSPVLIDFSRMRFTMGRMGPNDTCPDTHYRCPGEYNDCLPVYTQCNGWYDCMDREDEEGCEGRTCPGFYRCFSSTVCVHADHVCDGWAHCPQRDDEWLCNMTCPYQCLCQGHAFLCPRPFSAHLFPQLRCLDAGGSGMTPSDFKYNQYIVHLRLSRCSLDTLAVIKLFNLRNLDLSSNKLNFVNMTIFALLANLRTLSVRHNPLRLIYSVPNSAIQQTSLTEIDMSYTELKLFNSKAFSNFASVKSLNLSFTNIHTIHANGFHYTPLLVSLHIVGSPVQKFPADLFKHLSRLHYVEAGVYKLCCKEIFPEQSHLIICNAPSDEISSCKDLLYSGIYRMFLWLISFLSLFGNMFCLVMRVCVHKKVSGSGFQVFVTNLSMADLLMGMYIAIIGVADVLFRGKYLLYDEKWMHSDACKVAGFLSLLSSEVSAFIIWLITLDRFIVLHFPFSNLRFQKTSAAAACFVAWVTGGLLAVIPLLPVTSHWEFFGQTGICIPLPVTKKDFTGKTYSVGVFILLNFALFVFIAIGQALIFWSVKRNTLKAEVTKVSRDLTIAQRLISVAVTDFLCWFPIGLCGLLASTDTPVSAEVSVGLAIFVLPLNSALNPFIYTFNTVMEKRRKSKEAMLMKWLEMHSDLLDS